MQEFARLTALLPPHSVKGLGVTPTEAGRGCHFLLLEALLLATPAQLLSGFRTQASCEHRPPCTVATVVINGLGPAQMNGC